MLKALLNMSNSLYKTNKRKLFMRNELLDDFFLGYESNSRESLTLSVNCLVLTCKVMEKKLYNQNLQEIYCSLFHPAHKYRALFTQLFNLRLEPSTHFCSTKLFLPAQAFSGAFWQARSSRYKPPKQTVQLNIISGAMYNLANQYYLWWQGID